MAYQVNFVESPKSTLNSGYASLSLTHTHTHTHPFNGPLSRTTRVSWYQKGKTNLDFTEARDSEWQWHQLGHMQVCTALQTDSHASTPPVFYRPANQQCQSTEGSGYASQCDAILFHRVELLFKDLREKIKKSRTKLQMETIHKYWLILVTLTAN